MTGEGKGGTIRGMNRRLLLLLLAGPLFAGCGGIGGSGTAKPATASPATQAEAQPSSGPIGSAAHDGDLTVTVQSVQVKKEADYPGGFEDPDFPQYGQFVVADVLEQNNGGQMVSPGGFQVVTDEGQHYSATVESAFDPEIVQSGQGPLQPGGKIRGAVVFDVPVQHGTIAYSADGNVPVYSWTF